MSSVVAASPDGIVLTVRVIPRATRSEIAGTRQDALLIRLNAPPVDGAANGELIRVVARALQVPKRSIAIVAGARDRNKRLAIRGIDVETARLRLRGALAGADDEGGR